MKATFLKLVGYFIWNYAVYEPNNQTKKLKLTKTVELSKSIFTQKFPTIYVKKIFKIFCS